MASCVRAIATAAILAAATRAGVAQDAIRLELTYRPGERVGVVVAPAAAPASLAAIADSVVAILRRDLALDGRVELAPDTGVDWRLESQLEARDGHVRWRLALVDRVYRQVRQRLEATLPPLDGDRFRLAVHAAADEAIRWLTGSPGIAATRIAFVRAGRGSKEIYVVDSDGFGLRRWTTDGSIALSPAWSPDGRRLAYVTFRSGRATVVVRDLDAGTERPVATDAAMTITPAYLPDGSLLFAAARPDGFAIVRQDGTGTCCRLVAAAPSSDALSPSPSPDGQFLVFVSNRLGPPHLFVQPVAGGAARLLSPVRPGAYFVAPDWSPRGDAIAFAARVDGAFRIGVIRPDGTGLRWLTTQGNAEDPSWAPDGRRLVAATDEGLVVLDVTTGARRVLVRGTDVGLPAWSPRLGQVTMRRFP